MTESNIKVAVVGVGDFGRNHVRVWKEVEGVDLVGVMDSNPDRAAKVAIEFGTVALKDFDDLATSAQAVSLAVPTSEHARIGCDLLERGLDVLVEKPIAASLPEADALLAAAKRHNRILQIGHLERFNPAVIAAEKIIARPLFFEIHRLGVFSQRSLDVDVVYDDSRPRNPPSLRPRPSSRPPRGRHSGPNRQSRHRSRKDRIRNRGRRQSHRQPGLHRTRPQDALLSRA